MIVMRISGLASLAAGLACCSRASRPGRPTEQRIAAVVNDEVVSVPRSRRPARSGHAHQRHPRQPSRRAQRLAPQVLRSLIEETLQLQEARRLDIEVTRSRDRHTRSSNIAERNR